MKRQADMIMTDIVNMGSLAERIIYLKSPLERGRVGFCGCRGVLINKQRTHPSTPLKRGIAQPYAIVRVGSLAERIIYLKSPLERGRVGFCSCRGVLINGQN